MKITPERVAAYARVLLAARGAGAIVDEDFKHLHARFIVRSLEGTPWTVGLETGKWNRVNEGRWVPGDPPAELYLESEVLFELERLKSAVESGASDTRQASNAGASAPSAHDAGTAARPLRDTEAVAPPAHDIGGAPPPAPNPRRAPERIVERPSSTEWSPAFLCLVLGTALGAIGYAKSNSMAYGAAALFALLLVSILFLNSQSR